jgi:hypothetical membrane protein
MKRVRLGAIAGICGAALFTGGWILAGFLQPASYSWASQEISDLGALTAEHAWVWNLADSLSGALILCFAIGTLPTLGSSRAGRVGALAIGIVGCGSILDGLLREDCALSTSEACQRLQEDPGLSWHHQAHNIESVVVFIAIVMAPFAIARALRGNKRRRDLRAYTIAVAVIQIFATVAYLFLYGETGGGIAQRVVALAFMAWVAVLAIWALREASEIGPSSNEH